MKTIFEKPFVVVDLYSGSHCKNSDGFEKFNLEPNSVDGRYYGYMPPRDKNNLKKLGAKCKTGKAEDVIVIYVKSKKNSKDREVIAFTDSATVHKSVEDKNKLKELQRVEKVKDEDKYKYKYYYYGIESDTMYLIHDKEKFTIELKKYNRTHMFRSQRFYKGTYKELDNALLQYIHNYLSKIEYGDDAIYQGEIQQSEEKVPLEPEHSEPVFQNHGYQQVQRNAAIAKSVLKEMNFQCQINSDHITFKNSKGNPYMEGHHLIPCTARNVESFWKKQHRNLDCQANIVSLCPTCHRKIHFGTTEDKLEMIETLYKQQRKKLNQVGISVSLEDLKKLYEIENN